MMCRTSLKCLKTSLTAGVTRHPISESKLGDPGTVLGLFEHDSLTNGSPDNTLPWHPGNTHECAMQALPNAHGSPWAADVVF